jgi:hypothetical protein
LSLRANIKTKRSSSLRGRRTNTTFV